jgi:hydrogenase maturation factor HypF (carbamoyltransferase family)
MPSPAPKRKKPSKTLRKAAEKLHVGDPVAALALGGHGLTGSKSRRHAHQRNRHRTGQNEERKKG